MTFLSLSFFYCKIGVIICDPCPRQRAVRPQREDTCALQTLKHCTDVSGDTYHSLIFSCLLLSKTGDFLTIDLQVSLQLVGMAEWRETSVNGEPGPLLTGEINSGTSMCVGGGTGNVSHTSWLLCNFSRVPTGQGEGAEWLGYSFWTSKSGELGGGDVYLDCGVVKRPFKSWQVLSHPPPSSSSKLPARNCSPPGPCPPPCRSMPGQGCRLSH